ncbi:ABC transporter substrate-binding protein [Geobacter sp.]|uniref:ABC transporter substrate-binding protein n=1 Tax=Geobacter sp. TaxID=46610 RepID=UPI0027B90415|nr:ABC transporter substrate-binding protein [Geobacter sp.]
MTARILHILAVLLLWSFPAFAAEVVVVQGERMAPFEAALRGFEGTAGVRSVERFVLSDMRGADVARAVREARPRLVLAVGRDALVRVREIREIPVIYVMVATPEATGATGRNVTGVEMHVPAERYLSFFAKELGGKRVGIIHNPARTGALVREAREAAERLGITLVVRKADDPRETVRELSSLKGKVDVLWMLPDPTVVTRDTVEAFALFSQENRVPVVAFAAKYLQQGAVAAFEVDPADMGRQAGRMARRILDGAPPESLQPEHPAKTHLKVNPSVARHLGVTLKE